MTNLMGRRKAPWRFVSREHLQMKWPEQWQEVRGGDWRREQFDCLPITCSGLLIKFRQPKCYGKVFYYRVEPGREAATRPLMRHVGV